MEIGCSSDDLATQKPRAARIHFHTCKTEADLLCWNDYMKWTDVNRTATYVVEHTHFNFIISSRHINIMTIIEYVIWNRVELSACCGGIIQSAANEC